MIVLIPRLLFGEYKYYQNYTSSYAYCIVYNKKSYVITSSQLYHQRIPKQTILFNSTYRKRKRIKK